MTAFASQLSPVLRRAFQDVYKRLDDSLTRLGVVEAASASMVGAITDFIGATAPTNWLALDGATVVGGQTTYPQLWALLPASMKSGANIVLPDARGRVTVGLNIGDASFDTIGELGGAKTHTLTQAEMPSHVHQQQLGGAISTVANAPGGYVIGNANTANVTATGGGGSHNNLQPYIAFMKIVKAR